MTIPTSLMMAVGTFLAIVSLAYATDTRHLLPIGEALQSEEKQGKLDSSIKFVFGRENSSQALKVLRSETIRGKGHNSSGTVEKVCATTFLSILSQFHRRAKQLRADAVVNIVSSFRNHPEMSSSTLFECYQGSRTTSVMLRGDIVKFTE